MYKANGRLVQLMYDKTKVDDRVNKVKELKKSFSIGGEFEAFKHTSSYAEIPPINKSDDSGTYILREYKGVKLVTLGDTVFFVACKEFMKYLAVKPPLWKLGNTDLRVIKVEACYRYLNEEGRKFQQELLKNWYSLTLPTFSAKQF